MNAYEIKSVIGGIVFILISVAIIIAGEWLQSAIIAALGTILALIAICGSIGLINSIMIMHKELEKK